MIILHLLTISDVITAILLRSFSSSCNLQTGLASDWILHVHLKSFRIFW